MLTLLDGAISEEKTSPSPANRLAFELVGFLSQFPAMRAYFEHFPVFRLIDEAAAELPPAWVDSAKARGQKRDIWETGTELLEQLPELGWTKSAAQS